MLYEARTFGKGDSLLKIASVIFLMLLAIPGSLNAASSSRYSIVVDAGHGGSDDGVVADKLREKDATLSIALFMAEEAGRFPNLSIHLTRSKDETLSLKERIKRANALKPDCFLSLHINGGLGREASGYEVYFQGFPSDGASGGAAEPILRDMEANRYLNESVRLAQEIQAGLESIFPRKGRGLRDAPSPIFEGLAIPALVVETGFATNSEERKKLSQQETQRALARAILKGLERYFQKTR